jgi:hypothetical protein
VQATVESLATEESQRVPDVDNGVPIARFNERPLHGTRLLKLQPSLLYEKKYDGPDVGMFVVPHGIVKVLWRIVKKN